MSTQTPTPSWSGQWTHLWVERITKHSAALWYSPHHQTADSPAHRISQKLYRGYLQQRWNQTSSQMILWLILCKHPFTNEWVLSTLTLPWWCEPNHLASYVSHVQRSTWCHFLKDRNGSPEFSSIMSWSKVSSLVFIFWSKWAQYPAQMEALIEPYPMRISRALECTFRTADAT